MVYINHILKNLLLIFCLLGLKEMPGFSQTCCSGGVPLSGNIGFEGAAKGTLQTEWSYNLNYLATLKNGNEIYEDKSRQRISHSFLLKLGYSINKWFAIDALFSYVLQERKIFFNEQIDHENAHGLGDAVLMAKFILSSISINGSELQLGLGPKLPLGTTGRANKNNILFNADMQPGSGSWDLITWAYYARQFTERSTLVSSVRAAGRINGRNTEYLGSQSYKFGNSVQLHVGIGDQIGWRNSLVSPSLSFRFRYAGSDLVNGQTLDNTGGKWISVSPALSWHPGQRSTIHFVPELPLYSNVDGTQLTSSFRMQVGYYHSFHRKNRNNSTTFQL